MRDFHPSAAKSGGSNLGPLGTGIRRGQVWPQVWPVFGGLGKHKHSLAPSGTGTVTWGTDVASSPPIANPPIRTSRVAFISPSLLTTRRTFFVKLTCTYSYSSYSSHSSQRGVTQQRATKNEHCFPADCLPNPRPNDPVRERLQERALTASAGVMFQRLISTAVDEVDRHPDL